MLKEFLFVCFALILIFSACSKSPDITSIPEITNQEQLNTNPLKIVNDKIDNKDISILIGLERNGNQIDQGNEDNILWTFSRAFISEVEGKKVSLALIDSIGAFMKDEFGNIYNENGLIIHGPDFSKQLEQIPAFRSFWFATWPLSENLEIFEYDNEIETFQVEQSNDWLIPPDWILDALGEDGIPSIDTPKFQDLDLDLLDFPSDNKDVLVVSIGNESHIYPIHILDYHEIVNDEINGIHFSIGYCPLAGTTQVFKRDANNTFGVSGLLYQSTLLPFDRKSRSVWTQQNGLSVFGDQMGKKMELLPHTQMSVDKLALLSTSKNLILKEPEGSNLPYHSYQYTDYRTNEDFFVAPIRKISDSRIPNKEIVYVVPKSDGYKIYRALNLIN